MSGFRLVIGLAIFLAFLLGACGGGTKIKDTRSPTDVTKSIMLKPSDLPGSWLVSATGAFTDGNSGIDDVTCAAWDDQVTAVIYKEHAGDRLGRSQVTLSRGDPAGGLPSTVDLTVAAYNK